MHLCIGGPERYTIYGFVSCTVSYMKIMKYLVMKVTPKISNACMFSEYLQWNSRTSFSEIQYATEYSTVVHAVFQWNIFQNCFLF